MIDISDISDIEIPIWVKGTQNWVTGLTKRTTCDDVIYALLYQDDLHERESTSAYAIFEKWREVERTLQGRTKIIKVWRSWGAEKPNVLFSMRRIDELEYSGEFSLTRRKKRSGHKSRDRERRQCDHPHLQGYCHSTSERLRSMETLVKLVISQERNLKDLIENCNDTDKLIEKYESKLQAKKLLQNSDGNVKDAYWDSVCDSAMDDPFANVANVEELALYVEYCDRIIAQEERIKIEHSKVEDLAYQIQKCANESDAGDGKHFEGQEIANVQVELNRAVSCAIMQQYKFQDLQRELQFYDEQFKQKNDLYTRLQLELKELDSEQNINVSNESTTRANIAQVIANIAQSDYSNGSEFDNPLPLPERSKLVQNPHTPKAPLLPERNRPKTTIAPTLCEQNNIYANQALQEHVPEPKPILKTSCLEYKNGFSVNHKAHTKQSCNSETKVRFKTDFLTDKYQWDDSSVSEGISIDHSDCSDCKDIFEWDRKRDEYASIRAGVANRPYLTVKVEDNDSNSDTGLSSMHSDDSAVYHLETLV